MSEQINTQSEVRASPEAKVEAKTFGIADSAIRQLQKLLEARGTPQAGMRISVKGGGCSGLSYVMEWAEQPKEKDRVFEREGARVFVDSKSFLYLAGSELVYEQTLMSSMFKVQNPNAKSLCGCGESFSV
jgi:iron-sulfur cluster assembly protein